MRTVLLYNSKAGGTDDGLVDALQKRLDARAVDMIGSDVAQVAASHGEARIVLLGGDGSLHVAVQQLWDADRLGATELALIPTGTGNDFARGVGIPLDADGAADLARGGDARRFDIVAGSDGQVAVNALHAGIGAEAARAAEPMKNVLSAAAYPMGAMVAGATEGGWKVEVHADGEPMAGFGDEALLVGIANGPSIGGGSPLCPQADPADGLLDVVVAGTTGVLDRVAFAAALRKGEHLDLDDVVHARATEVVIEGDPMRYDIDGEVDDEPRPSGSWRVVPGALRLVAPPATG